MSILELPVKVAVYSVPDPPKSLSVPPTAVTCFRSKSVGGALKLKVIVAELLATLTSLLLMVTVTVGPARSIVVLRHKTRRMLLLNRRAQYGHLGSALAIA